MSERPMPKPFSHDLRARVIEAIEAGASRRKAAELYGISPSVVLISA
jgi:transposase